MLKFMTAVMPFWWLAAFFLDLHNMLRPDAPWWTRVLNLLFMAAAVLLFGHTVRLQLRAQRRMDVLPIPFPLARTQFTSTLDAAQDSLGEDERGLIIFRWTAR